MSIKAKIHSLFAALGALELLVAFNWRLKAFFHALLFGGITLAIFWVFDLCKESCARQRYESICKGISDRSAKEYADPIEKMDALIIWVPPEVQAHKFDWVWDTLGYLIWICLVLGFMAWFR